jgi:hypothetical protein
MSDQSDDPDPEELLQQSKERRRTSTEATESDTSKEVGPTLAEAVATALDDIEEGEMNSTFGFRDEKLVALLAGLERSGELTDVVVDAQEELGRDPNPAKNSRSEAGRLLIRLGLQSLDERILEEAREGYEKHLTSKADQF